MEVLKHKLMNSQAELEDALRMEIEYDEVRGTKEGKQLLKWLRRRRKMVEAFYKRIGEEQV
jgi:Mn-dependent DtxR family transcriptional regulator